MTALQTRHLTILFTDIKGFTDKTSNRSRTNLQRLLDDYREVVLPVLQDRGGRLIKTIGDAFLMIFDSPTDAVLAGIAAQEALAKRNAELPEQDRIEIRVAINAGEVNLAQEDVFGEAVNIASRIEGVAEAGEVYFTEAVYLAMNKAEVPSSEVGLLQLKGIPEKVRVYKVRRETPLGVGQLPPKAPARAASPDCAPGEKARMVSGPASPGPGETKPAQRWRRIAALALDAMICMTLLAALTGGNADLRGDLFDRERTEITTAAIDDRGVGVRNEDGSTVLVNGSGVRVETPGVAAERRRPAKRRFLPIAWFIYNFLFLWGMAATPGKKAFRLRVVGEDGAPPDGRRCAVRAAMSLVSAMLALMLGYAWGLWDKKGRTWHDAAAGTRVVAAV